MKRIALLAAVLSAGLMASGCKVVVTGQSTYETCDFDSDCNSTLDSCVPVSNGSFSDAHCTRGCTNDLDCPGSGHCVDFGSGGTCFQTCITNAICEVGWGCTDLSDGSAVCLPGNGTPTPIGIPAYDECVSATDPCAAGTQCLNVSVEGATRGICTTTCNPSACPADSRGNLGECIAFDGVNYFCFEGCSGPSDCAAGFACKASFEGGSISLPRPICVPST